MEKENTENTQKYVVDFNFAGPRKAEIVVPDGVNHGEAHNLFCAAMNQIMRDDGFSGRRQFCICRCDREYSGFGGLFQTYWMSGDSVIAEVWMEAYIV